MPSRPQRLAIAVRNAMSTLCVALASYRGSPSAGFVAVWWQTDDARVLHFPCFQSIGWHQFEMQNFSNISATATKCNRAGRRRPTKASQVCTARIVSSVGALLGIGLLLLGGLLLTSLVDRWLQPTQAKLDSRSLGPSQNIYARLSP